MVHLTIDQAINEMAQPKKIVIFFKKVLSMDASFEAQI